MEMVYKNSFDIWLLADIWVFNGRNLSQS